ncbi:NVEALA domain-containing protein [Parabacteroides bouchesdurhonensis]|uniref:NVEALA domain-containing protein n=1 Tax=Parabacteroides bouchesdurhonensis TaxID=1936995 RepID=UPI00131BAE28|nr:NVEALA domain-containing protein [Parabacteroides bouchesdurhonensis]
MKTSMTKKMLLIIGVLSFFFVSAFLVEQHEENGDIQLCSNVEALAGGEGGGDVHCYNSGTVDCYGFKVEEITYWSLEEFE